MLTNEVFIVDDDPSVSAALSVVLSGEGYQVASFVEGETFLAAARSRTPGCVLLDVHLPGSSGLDLLCIARASWRSSAPRTPPI